METKTQNLVIKILIGLIIFLGVLFTIWVMGDDNPKELSYEQQRQWAINEAIDQGLADKMDQMQLNSFLSERTAEIAQEKEETLWSDVSKLINFSLAMIYLAAALVLGAFIYLIVIDKAKALRILAGVGIFSLFMLIVYMISDGGNDTDMKLAGTAINSTIILISIALAFILHGIGHVGKIGGLFLYGLGTYFGTGYIFVLCLLVGLIEIFWYYMFFKNKKSLTNKIESS